MLWIFGLIVGLIAVILIPNAVFAFRQFMAKRDLAWFFTYMSFLILLAFLLVHITTRTSELVQKAKEVYEEPTYPN